MTVVDIDLSKSAYDEHPMPRVARRSAGFHAQLTQRGWPKELISAAFYRLSFVFEYLVWHRLSQRQRKEVDAAAIARRHEAADLRRRQQFAQEAYQV